MFASFWGHADKNRSYTVIIHTVLKS